MGRFPRMNLIPMHALHKSVTAVEDLRRTQCVHPQDLPYWSSALKVAGHPVRSAARLHVEIEWEICRVDLSFHQNLWQKLRP